MTRIELLNRMIRIYGFEGKTVIEFARLCENEYMTDKELETIVQSHEE